MLAPARSRSVCSGGPWMPQVSVRAVLNGRVSTFSGSPFCDWPVGTPLGIYWAAAEGNTRALDRVEPRLRCDDDPALLAMPTPWASVEACLHDLWTPRVERLIRLAEQTPQIAALQPARLFPRDIGARRCAIGAGGPSPGRKLHGTCGVSIKHAPGQQPVVTFVETWAVGRRIWHHTWHIRLTDGRSELTRQTGAVPPQLWR
jgi:hypothetical protein